MDNKRITVLGAGGFIGSHMVAYLKEKGHFVRAIGKSFPQMRTPLFSQADEILHADIIDLRAAIRACQEVDYVINLAADMGGVGYFSKKEYEPFIRNMTIDMNVMKACELTGVKRLLYASSACIYPVSLQMQEGKAPKLAENMILPADCDQMYGWEKLMGLKLCEKAPYDARVAILNTVFGPYQEIDGEKRKFPTAIAMKSLESKKTGNPIEIWGNGKQIRSFIYIDDALEKLYRVLFSDAYFGPVNVASEDAKSVVEYADICCEILDIPKNYIFKEAEPSGVLARNTDNTNFKNWYQYDNQVTTKEGFTRLIDWIQTQ